MFRFTRRSAIGTARMTRVLPSIVARPSGVTRWRKLSTAVPPPPAPAAATSLDSTKPADPTPAAGSGGSDGGSGGGKKPGQGGPAAALGLVMAIAGAAGIVWMQRNVFGPRRQLERSKPEYKQTATPEAAAAVKPAAKPKDAAPAVSAPAPAATTKTAAPSPTAVAAVASAPSEDDAEGEHPLLSSLYLHPDELPPHLRGVLQFGLPAPHFSHSPQVRIRPTYIMWYNPYTRNADWVLEHLTRQTCGLSENPSSAQSLGVEGAAAAAAANVTTAEHVSTRERSVFRVDPSLSIDTPQARMEDYHHSGYDRGHLAAAANARGCDQAAMDDTFYLTNISPQNASFNRNYWAGLERLLRHWTRQYDSVYVVTGSLFVPTSSTSPNPSPPTALPTPAGGVAPAGASVPVPLSPAPLPPLAGIANAAALPQVPKQPPTTPAPAVVPAPAETAAPGASTALAGAASPSADGSRKRQFVTYEVLGEPANVLVPSHFYKIVLGVKHAKPGTAAAAAGATAEPTTVIGAFVLPNQPIPFSTPLTNFMVPLNVIERAAGFDFFPFIERNPAAADPNGTTTTALCTANKCVIQAFEPPQPHPKPAAVAAAPVQPATPAPTAAPVPAAKQ